MPPPRSHGCAETTQLDATRDYAENVVELAPTIHVIRSAPRNAINAGLPDRVGTTLLLRWSQMRAAQVDTHTTKASGVTGPSDSKTRRHLPARREVPPR